jgi:hypothetical protein
MAYYSIRWYSHFPERHNSGNDVSALHVSAIIPV